MSGAALTVGLVGCAARKLQGPAPARELYVSQLFRKASAYAEATCDRWYILSAKHGLVHPDTVLEPYDVRLGAGPRTLRLTSVPESLRLRRSNLRPLVHPLGQTRPGAPGHGPGALRRPPRRRPQR
jgi:hypothetical protein